MLDTGDYTAVASKVLADVLEKQAFMFADPTEDVAAPATEMGYLKADMRFQGPLSGAVTIMLPEAMCREVAVNMLGLDENCFAPGGEEGTVNPRDASLDALRELLNVVCGNILTELVGATPVFDLSVPVASPADVGEWEKYANQTGTAVLIVEEAPVLLNLKIIDRCP